MQPTYKQRYPFRLSTTSFIYPADYATNVRHLGPIVDEIELLLLESNHLPSRQEIAELKIMAQDLGIVYNVHLPMDVALADASTAERNRSGETVAKAIDLVNPLEATTHTLHLAYHQTDQKPETVNSWQNRAIKAMRQLLGKLPIMSRKISIETLDFSPYWIKPIIDQLGLSVCLDVGHVIRYGYNLERVMMDFGPCTTIVHLHGVADGQDHRSLARLDPDARRIVRRFLKNFTGSVSLEVFSYQRLMDSLTCLDDLMHEELEKGAIRNPEP